MDNDEKTAPDGDAVLLPDGDDPFQARPEVVEAASTDGDTDINIKLAKAVPFPGPRSEPMPPGLDDSFGMPDFGFFSESPVKQAKSVPADPVVRAFSTNAFATSASASEPSANESAPSVTEPAPSVTEPTSLAGAFASSSNGPVLPLHDGTGWETVGSIMKSPSLRERIKAQEADDAVIEQLFANDDETPITVEAEKPAAPRHDANVTPFPGIAVQRGVERVPSDILRGASKSAEVFEDITIRAGDEQVATPLEEAANPDALADAVQSALRNIYGSYTEAPEERADMSGFTVADALAGADNQPNEAAWPEERSLSASADWQRSSRGRDYDAPSPEPEGASSDAVLDYFYTQQRRQERAAPQLSTEMSLSDYAARTQRDEKWPEEEPEEEPQRVMPFPARGDRAPTYRARGPELSTAGEASLGLGGFFREEQPVIRPAHETEWGQTPYGAPPQNARGSITPTYAPTVTVPAEQLPPPQSPDSGHLLGAAGLGLIGGIALAGVLAVFVFNSFVDESGQDGGSKVVERLAPAQTATNPTDTRSSSDNRNAQFATAAQSASTLVDLPSLEPQRQAALSTPAPAPVETAKPKLAAAPVTGAPDNPIRLNITLGDLDVGDALVSLKGLPKDARLSTGIDVGGGQWLLPPGRLKDLTVSAPASAVGNFPLEAQLLKDDAQTSISDAVPFVLSISTAARPASGQPAPSAAPAPQKPEASRLAALPDEAPLPETDFLTQMLIRDGNKKMREGDIASARRLYEQATVSGNAEAALAMGRSYDPTYFEKLNVKTGKPDPATAFEWYKKALDGGLVTAKVKIDALKQWLQR